ncbi:MAG: DEAD/DEAH box helicase [Deltaproteobacteria bacterium]|nr:DEAD/DEAH box helicase [Deltaproteobacteria bacterium]
MKPEPDALPETEPTFASLGLPAHLLETVAGLGFAAPTTIQSMAIPSLMSGRDVIAQARTGTGKTAAFGLPLVARLSATRPPSPVPVRALVLTPTRELALQVTEALQDFAKGLPLRVLTVYGGAPYGAQLRGLRDGVDIVVGTPGRVIDLIDRGSLLLVTVEHVVLDEADEMLEMGFIEAVETILAETPPSRQVALFSATMPEAIRRVAQRHLKDPVSAKEAVQNVAAIAQKMVQVPNRFKIEALVRILRSEVRDATLVFAGTRAACAEAADALIAAGIPAEPLHGDLAQPARERVVELLRQRRVQVVVATDIAARGIDIDHLTHIVNLDLPRNVEIYTHRIGRTGRAGRTGTAITLVTPREAGGFVNALARRGIKVEEMFLPSEHELAMRKRDALATELKAFIEEPAPELSREEAKRWVDRLVGSGMPLEELTTGLLGMLAESRGMSLGKALDKGLPPWARQPSAPGAQQGPAPHGPPRGGPGVDARDRGPRPGPAPQGPEALVRIGIGRRHGTRPGDVVGALTNELGLAGSDVGRVELRDEVTIVGLPGAFVARLGNEVWPLQVRGVDTTLVRHDEPPMRAPPPRGPRPPLDDRPPRGRPDPRPHPADRPVGRGPRHAPHERPAFTPGGQPGGAHRPPRRSTGR